MSDVEMSPNGKRLPPVDWATPPDNPAPTIDVSDQAIEPPVTGLGDELVDGSDAVQRADPDGSPVAPGLEIRVEAARQALGSGTVLSP